MSIILKNWDVQTTKKRFDISFEIKFDPNASIREMIEAFYLYNDALERDTPEKFESYLRYVVDEYLNNHPEITNTVERKNIMDADIKVEMCIEDKTLFYSGEGIERLCAYDLELRAQCDAASAIVALWEFEIQK